MNANFFSSNYQAARRAFLAAARQAGAETEAFPLPQPGRQGEELAIDTACIRPRSGARRLFLMTSATHGVEGFCGSACQLALLHDRALRDYAGENGIALLLVHALNPYGFSWLSRTNEDNIDLNRNSVDFERALPHNDAYDEIHPWLIPQTWPPTDDVRNKQAAYVATHGAAAYRDAASRGQYRHPDGIFYGGSGRSFSKATFTHVLQKHAAEATDVAWIDVHSGLGPYGHGEKIYSGPRDPASLERARKWWGIDIVDPHAGQSTSADVQGFLGSDFFEVLPARRAAMIALEYGTLPFLDMVDSVRGEAWLRSHPEAPAELAESIRRTVQGAFFLDEDPWRGMVLGQSRLAVLQALRGLASAEP